MCKCSLYVPDTSSLSNMWFENNSLHFMGCDATFFVPFEIQHHFLILIKINFFFFVLFGALILFRIKSGIKKPPTLHYTGKWLYEKVGF